MDKEDAKKRLNKCFKKLNKRNSMKEQLILSKIHAGIELFLAQWNNPDVQYYSDHLISTAEFVAYENGPLAAFIPSLFHHLPSDLLPSDFSRDKKLIENLQSLDDKFLLLENLISTFIDTYQKSSIELFKENTIQIIQLIERTDGLEALIILLASKINDLKTGFFIEDWHNSLPEIAERSLFFFVPFTHFLGFSNWTARMEGYALQYIEPESKAARQNYAAISTYNRFMPLLFDELNKLLNRQPAINVIDFSWRTKGVFSIWEKVKKSGSEPRDIIGFRIVVEDITQCRIVRDRIISRFRIRSTKHDDYFLTRSADRYRAIHLGLAKIDLPEGCPSVEVQIRDWENHFRAEDGDLRHASYKLKDRKHLRGNEKNLNEIWMFWLNCWLTNFLGKYTIVRMSDGSIIKLDNKPKILDLLHHIGKLKPNIRTRAIRNKNPLDETKPLITGDIITLIEKESTSPAYNTGSFDCAAHAAARQWLNNTIFKNDKSSVIDYADERIKAMFQERKIPKEIQRIILDRNDYEKICTQVANNDKKYMEDKLLREFFTEEKDRRRQFYNRFNQHRIAYFRSLFTEIPKPEELTRSSSDLKAGIESSTSNYNSRCPASRSIPFVYHGKITTFRKLGVIPNSIRSAPDKSAFGLCCNPTPGDKIVGSMNSENGFVIVHRKSCFLAKYTTPGRKEKTLEYEWKNWRDKKYEIGLEVFSFDISNLMRKFEKFFADQNINIHKMISHTRAMSRTVLISCSFTYPSRKRLNNLLKSIRKSDHIINVQRSPHPVLLSYSLPQYDVFDKNE